MSPANIEAKLKTSSPVIGQAIAIGDGRPYNVALITLDPDVAPAYEQHHGREALLAEVERGIEAGNEQLAQVRREAARQRLKDRSRSRSSSCSTGNGSPAATS
jgi:long-chain acyl-CoA synthetase